MILQTTTIARNTFVESVRQPIYFIVLLLAGALQIFTTWSTAYSMSYSDSAEIVKDNKLLFDIGLATILVSGMLLAAFVATAVLSREIESKTVLTVVSKPISRTAIVLGKYLGVAGSLAIAVLIMTTFLLLAIRHGVMTTAADDPDQPVIIFSSIAVLLSVGIAGWCNFYYGWSFPQTASMILLPAILVAYVVVLLFSKEWEVQPLATDFKPQVTLATSGVLLALLVLAAAATAFSTRLGQVMTIVTCIGVLMLGLLSNYMIGRHAYQNDSVAIVGAVTADTVNRDMFERNGDKLILNLRAPPTERLNVGEPVYYGANPNGFRIANRLGTQNDEGPVQGIVIDSVVETETGTVLTLRQQGEGTFAERPPSLGDHIFLRPTSVNPAAATIHAVVPNFQHYWLVDAITRNSKIPPSHLQMLGGYAAAQIVMFLALGVFLFQRRDVG